MNQVCPKRVFPVQHKKVEQHHWILDIRIRLGAIFLGAMALLGQSRELTNYGTARSPRKFTNENAMALLGQVRESWPFMAPLGHVDLTKAL